MLYVQIYTKDTDHKELRQTQFQSHLSKQATIDLINNTLSTTLAPVTNGALETTPTQLNEWATLEGVLLDRVHRTDYPYRNMTDITQITKEQF